MLNYHLRSFTTLFFSIMPSMLVLWKLYWSPMEESQSYSNWFFSSYINIINDSVWSSIACFDFMLGLLIAIYYGLQYSVFGPLTDEEMRELGKAVFKFLRAKSLLFFTIDLDMWEAIIWIIWFIIISVLLSLTQLVELRTKTEITEMNSSEFIYNLVFMLMMTFVCFFVIFSAYNLFWDDLRTTAPGWTLIILMISDSWYILFHILRVLLLVVYAGHCTYKRVPCDKHLIHSLKFTGKLMRQVTFLFMMLHFLSIKGWGNFSIRWVLIISRIQVRLIRILKIVQDYLAYCFVLGEIESSFPMAEEEKINGELCTICRETLKPGAKLLPCGHIFDSQCLREWMRIKRECPICRVHLGLRTLAEQREDDASNDPFMSATQRFTRILERFRTERQSSRDETELQQLSEIFSERSATEINEVFRRLGSIEETVEHFLRVSQDQ